MDVKNMVPLQIYNDTGTWDTPKGVGTSLRCRLMYKDKSMPVCEFTFPCVDTEERVIEEVSKLFDEFTFAAMKVCEKQFMNG